LKSKRSVYNTIRDEDDDDDDDDGGGGDGNNCNYNYITHCFGDWEKYVKSNV
jgi:hypothetical protein